jgi:hypothetical protein
VRLIDTNKLYKKLAPIPAATLAFEANVRRDTAEMLAITESQPQQYFVGASIAYRKRVMSLTQLSLIYGAFYWRSRAILLQRLSTYDENAVLKIAATLGSMEQALIKTCGQLAVNVESVKKLGAVPDEDSYGEFADEALTTEYIEIFMGCM